MEIRWNPYIYNYIYTYIYYTNMYVYIYILVMYAAKKHGGMVSSNMSLQSIFWFLCFWYTPADFGTPRRRDARSSCCFGPWSWLPLAAHGERLSTTAAWEQKTKDPPTWSIWPKRALASWQGWGETVGYELWKVAWNSLIPGFLMIFWGVWTCATRMYPHYCIINSSLHIYIYIHSTILLLHHCCFCF